MSELVQYRQPDQAAQLVAWADAAQAAFHLAQSLVKTEVCPPPFRGKAEEACAVVLLGAELGLSPIASLRSMYSLRGQIGMYVRGQVALAQSRGHRIWTESETDDAVTVAGHRAGDPEHVERVTWTIARARQAGFIRRGQRGEPSQYESQPRTMLWSRAAGDVARRIAADVLAGVPELDEPPEPLQAVSEAPATSGVRVQRQPRKVEDERAASDPTATVTSAPTAPDLDDGPPPPQESPRDDGEPTDTLPEPPEDEAEPMITRPQMNMLQALFIRAGARSPEQRHAYLTRVLERPVESSNDITVTEASMILDRLKAQVDGDV